MDSSWEGTNRRERTASHPPWDPSLRHDPGPSLTLNRTSTAQARIIVAVIHCANAGQRTSAACAWDAAKNRSEAIPAPKQPSSRTRALTM